MFGLEPLELPDERVELRVGYLGVAEDVIALFVVAYEAAEFVDAFGRRHRSRERT
jgi:hypothetical protein